MIGGWAAWGEASDEGLHGLTRANMGSHGLTWDHTGSRGALGVGKGGLGGWEEASAETYTG